MIGIRTPREVRMDIGIMTIEAFKERPVVISYDYVET